jgi:hypothetical protein
MVEWVHEETHYFKNERGDVAYDSGDYCGFWDGKDLHEDAGRMPDNWETERKLYFPNSIESE